MHASTSPSITRKFVSLLVSALAFVTLGLAGAKAAQQTTGTVSYTPTLQIVSGNMPFGANYVLSVKSPANFPVGQTATIGFTINPTAFPASLTAAQVLNFITVTPVTTGTFSTANQTLNFTVQLNFPVVTPAPGETSVSYAYQIYTNNWPAALTGLYTDFGASVGATATVPNSGGGIEPPVVSISSPADGDVFTYPAGTTFPVQIPLSFHAQTPSGSMVESLDASLGITMLTVSSPVLPRESVDATSTMTIPSPGIYTVQARAGNTAGTSAAAVTFTVKVANPPPTVVINTPADGSTYSLNLGSTLSVPFQFTGTSRSQGITALTATLDGLPLTFGSSGLSTLTALGTASLGILTGGEHVLSVTATDDIGTVSATSKFTVTLLSPTPAIVITSPANGTSLTHTAGTPALNVPFTFNTTTTLGFTISSVSAKLDNNPVTISNTTGLGTAFASSSGTLTGVSVGTHTLTATGVSAGITVTTSVNFTITETGTLPPTVVINTPPVNSTYTYVQGGTALAIPMTFTGTSRSNGITTLTATLDGNAISVTPSGIGSLTANGASTLSVTTAGTHTIVVKATDNIGTATASRTFTVCVVKPVLCLNITKPDDCLTITRTTGSAATLIPLTFTAQETNGTVTTLSAKLNNTAVTLTSTTGLNAGTASGAATLSVTAAGTYTVLVTATGTGGLTATDTVKFTVKETQPTQQPCSTKVLWQGTCSQGKVITGGCAVNIGFQIQQSTTSSSNDDDDNDSYGSGCYSGGSYGYGSWDDDDDDDRSGSTCGSGNGGGTVCLLNDKTVILSVCEVYSNGSTSAAKTYTYATSSNSTHYTIDSSKSYKTSFKPSSGKHRYRFEVYYFAAGSTKAKVIGTSELTTK
jgi:hypothetical protein